MRRPGPSLLLVVLMLGAGACVAAQPQVEVLDNGLAVAVDEDHAAPLTAVAIGVGAGIANEGPYLGSGISHLVEHCVYGGTEVRSADDLTACLESMGNAYNGWTWYDVTYYSISVTADQWLAALGVLADFVFQPAFPPEEVQRQQGIIKREVAMDADDPPTRISELWDEVVFRGNPCAATISGYPELFATLIRDDVVARHRATYVPGNAVVVVVGDVVLAEVVARCRELCGALPHRAPQVPAWVDAPPQTMPRRRVVVQRALEQAYLDVGYRTVDLLHPDAPALDLAGTILGEGGSARLVSKLRDELGLVTDISVEALHLPHCGYFVVSATLHPSAAPRVEEAILAELDRLCSERISREELARAKALRVADFVRGQQTADIRAQVQAIDYLRSGDPSFLQRRLERLRTVTPADLQHVARTHFRPERLCTVLLTPQAPRAERGAARAAMAPPVEKLVLDNGLTVLIGRRTNVPLVAVEARVLGGVRAETAQNNGICSLMANCLLRGTTSRSREKIRQAVEDAGGTISASADFDTFSVRITCLAADVPRVLALMADVLRHPAFAPAEFEAQRQLALSQVAAEADDVFQVARRALARALYTRHPYGMQPSGTGESLGRLSCEDVADFYAAVCRPDRAVLAVEGDLDAAGVRTLVTKEFGGWQPAAAPLPAPEAEPPCSAPREERIPRDQGQTLICLGFPGPRTGDEQYYPREVLDAVLSGKWYPGGVLYNTLRAQQLVYQAYAWSQNGLDPGYFGIVAATAPEKADQALATIRQILSDARAAAPSAEALATGKRMCVMAHETNLERLSARATAAADDELRGVGHDRSEHYAERINAVTAEEVQQVARDLLDPQRCVTVVVGPKR